jgi:hypothetical protein
MLLPLLLPLLPGAVADGCNPALLGVRVSEVAEDCCC